MKDGKYFEEAYDVVLGYNVAKENKLSVGDKLVGSHGVSESTHSHDNTPYTIVGILEETHTAYDNTLFTQTDSVWKTHKDDSHSEETENCSFKVFSAVFTTKAKSLNTSNLGIT